ncbi:MAG: molybdenum cofactor biosynthesis protein B, partial [Chloroflexota bacterium]
MGADDHRAKAGTDTIGVGFVTVSDTRTPETDKNHAYLKPRLEELGHELVRYTIIKDEPDQVEAVLNAFTEDPAVRILIFNGGTGIAPRDTTYDVISRMLEKTLPGFGEIFRVLSYEEVGAAAMLSRAIGGVYHNTVVFSTPGSTNAVKTALEKLILPELN